MDPLAFEPSKACSGIVYQSSRVSFVRLPQPQPDISSTQKQPSTTNGYATHPDLYVSAQRYTIVHTHSHASPHAHSVAVAHLLAHANDQSRAQQHAYTLAHPPSYIHAPPHAAHRAQTHADRAAHTRRTRAIYCALLAAGGWAVSRHRVVAYGRSRQRGLGKDTRATSVRRLCGSDFRFPWSRR
jgi:hypothetical protein